MKVCLGISDIYFQHRYTLESGDGFTFLQYKQKSALITMGNMCKNMTYGMDAKT